MKRWPYVLPALVFAYLAKRWYSQASPEALRWILAPTAHLVGSWYRAPFVFEPGYGYLSRELRFGIVPACAGVNFLIVVLGAFTCGILPQAAGARRWLALGLGLSAAYALTVLANAVRISVAVWLERHPVALDPVQAHRVEGSLVYLTFLFAFYSLAQRLVERHAR